MSVRFDFGWLIVDSPRDGATNMAIDDALADWAASDGRPVLRFYAWRVPTLSLGYFQHAGDRPMHSASTSCPVVRRATGGGAIVHDHELTYAVALPQLDRTQREARWLYEAFHESLVASLAEWSIRATMVEPSSDSERPAASSPVQPAFLCFQRRAEGDVLVGKNKVAGSAQRRRAGAVLQHGSVLLRQSEFAPELPGVVELTGRAVLRDELMPPWQERISQRLGCRWEIVDTIPPNVLAAANSSRELKFAADSWTSRR